jgi:hypothetical protein
MKNIILTAIFASIFTLVSSQIDTISNNIFQLDGNLGVGVSNPSSLLEIKDNVSSGNKRNFIKLHNSNDNSYTGLLFQSGANDLLLSGFQEYGLNYDSSPFYDFAGFFNISSKVRGIMLHANSADGIIKFYTGHDETAGAGFERLRIDSKGNIGIGTDSPEHALTIEGTETGWPRRVFLSVNNKSTGSNSLAQIRVKAGPSNNHTILGHISETYTANDSPEDLQDYGMVSSNGKGLIIGASRNNLQPGIIKFVSGQSTGTTFDERMRIDTTGNIGIGTKEPGAKLEIADGDIFISNIEYGIIMKSPDGNCWKGVLDNTGNLNFMQIDCPGTIVSLAKKAEHTDNIKIYPNPTNDIISVQLVQDSMRKNKYSIYSPGGQLLDKGILKSNNQDIDISDYSAGIYLLTITDRQGNRLTSRKIVKN